MSEISAHLREVLTDGTGRTYGRDLHLMARKYVGLFTISGWNCRMKSRWPVAALLDSWSQGKAWWQLASIELDDEYDAGMVAGMEDARVALTPSLLAGAPCRLVYAPREGRSTWIFVPDDQAWMTIAEGDEINQPILIRLALGWGPAQQFDLD